MAPQPFQRLQPPAHDPPRVIILRQDQILVAAPMRQPAVVGGVMVPQGPGADALPPDVDLADLPAGLVIVPLTDRPPPHAIPAQDGPKALVGGLRQDREIT